MKLSKIQLITLITFGYRVFPHLSVSRNIGFGLELKGWKAVRIREEVERIVEVMNLKDMYHRRPDQLSGGQQQRASVLLFDEPLSNLDAKLREQMRVEIRRIQQTFKITSVYVTHDQDEAMTVSDRIVVMNDGEVMQVGTPVEIYSRPANLFVADFIGKVNLIEGRVVEQKGKAFTVEYAGGLKEIASVGGALKEGQKMLTMIRPESLRLEQTRTSHSDFPRGKVVKMVYLGPTVEYELAVDGQKRTIAAVVSNPIEAGFFDIGEEVALDFHPQAAHLLPGWLQPRCSGMPNTLGDSWPMIHTG